MDNMAELLNLHQMIDLDCLRLADAVHVVPSQVNQHDVFRAVFLRGKKNGSQFLVL